MNMTVNATAAAVSASTTFFSLFPSPAAKFVLASNGRIDMLSWESSPSFIPRRLMVTIVILQGLVGFGWMMKQYTQSNQAIGNVSTSSTSTPWHVSVVRRLRYLFIWSLICHLFHIFHYADNIRNPAMYCEPKWLYRSYVFTEMEITFFFFTPLTYLPIRMAQLIQQLLVLTHSSSTGSRSNMLVDARNLFYLSLIYLCASGLSGGHYFVEPPASYPLQANISIMGELITAGMFAFEAYRFLQLVTNRVSIQRTTYSIIDHELEPIR